MNRARRSRRETARRLCRTASRLARDLVSVRWTGGGTSTGDLPDCSATGRYADVATSGQLRLRGGGIAEVGTIVGDAGFQLQAAFPHPERIDKAGW